MTSNDNQAAEKQVSFYLHGKHVLVVDVNRRNCDAAKAILSESGAALVECVWDYRKVLTAIQNPKFDMILADWSSVQPGDGSAHDSSSPTRRQKTKATPRGSSKLNLLKAVQSLEVQTPVVFMHFKEQLDEVKSTLLETIVKDGRKKRYYLMTKPLQKQRLETLIDHNEVISRVCLKLTDVTDDYTDEYIRELQFVCNRRENMLQNSAKSPTKIKLQGIRNASKVIRLGSEDEEHKKSNFLSVKQTAQQAFNELNVSPGKLVPYWQQGNMDYYTDEKLSQRLKLKQQPTIVHAIRMFWSAVDLTKDTRGCIRKSSYVCLNVKLQKALDRDFQLGTALVMAKADWKRDGGRRRMTYGQFFEAMFEMTDIWCQTVSEKEYVAFLLSLLETVANGSAKPLKVEWKEDKQITNAIFKQVSRKRNLVLDPDEAETPETEEPEEEEIVTDLPDADEAPKPETDDLPDEQPTDNWTDEVIKVTPEWRNHLDLAASVASVDSASSSSDDESDDDSLHDEADPSKTDSEHHRMIMGEWNAADKAEVGKDKPKKSKMARSRTRPARPPSSKHATSEAKPTERAAAVAEEKRATPIPTTPTTPAHVPSSTDALATIAEPPQQTFAEKETTTKKPKLKKKVKKAKNAKKESMVDPENKPVDMSTQNYDLALRPEVQDHLDTPNPAVGEPVMEGHAATSSGNEPKYSKGEDDAAQSPVTRGPPQTTPPRHNAFPTRPKPSTAPAKSPSPPTASSPKVVKPEIVQSGQTRTKPSATAKVQNATSHQRASPPRTAAPPPVAPKREVPSAPEPQPRPPVAPASSDSTDKPEPNPASSAIEQNVDVTPAVETAPMTASEPTSSSKVFAAQDKGKPTKPTIYAPATVAAKPKPKKRKAKSLAKSQSKRNVYSAAKAKSSPRPKPAKPALTTDTKDASGPIIYQDKDKTIGTADPIAPNQVSARAELKEFDTPTAGAKQVLAAEPASPDESSVETEQPTTANVPAIESDFFDMEKRPMQYGQRFENKSTGEAKPNIPKAAVTPGPIVTSGPSVLSKPTVVAKAHSPTHRTRSSSVPSKQVLGKQTMTPPKQYATMPVKAHLARRASNTRQTPRADKKTWQRKKELAQSPSNQNDALKSLPRLVQHTKAPRKQSEAQPDVEVGDFLESSPRSNSAPKTSRSTGHTPRVKPSPRVVVSPNAANAANRLRRQLAGNLAKSWSLLRDYDSCGLNSSVHSDLNGFPTVGESPLPSPKELSVKDLLSAPRKNPTPRKTPRSFSTPRSNASSDSFSNAMNDLSLSKPEDALSLEISAISGSSSTKILTSARSTRTTARPNTTRVINGGGVFNLPNTPSTPMKWTIDLPDPVPETSRRRVARGLFYAKRYYDFLTMEDIGQDTIRCTKQWEWGRWKPTPVNKRPSDQMSNSTLQTSFQPQLTTRDVKLTNNTKMNKTV